MEIQNSNLNEDTIKRILEDNYNIETSKVTKIDSCLLYTSRCV